MKQWVMIRFLLTILLTGLGTAGYAATAEPATRPASGSLLPVKPESVVARDVYYRVEGIVSGPPAPQLSPEHYPTVLGESRVIVWIVA